MKLTKGSTFDILDAIREVGAGRSMENIHRRLMKLGEEYGEVLQAYLALTGNNYKGMTADDLREELVDIVLVSLDLLLHRVPGEENLSEDELGMRIEAVFRTKIEKWQRIRAAEPVALLQAA